MYICIYRYRPVAVFCRARRSRFFAILRLLSAL